MIKWQEENGKLGNQILFYYPICPDCAKKYYGDQITVLMSKI